MTLLHLQFTPVCAVLLCCIGDFGGGWGVAPRRRSRALYPSQQICRNKKTGIGTEAAASCPYALNVVMCDIAYPC